MGHWASCRSSAPHRFALWLASSSIFRIGQILVWYCSLFHSSLLLFLQEDERGNLSSMVILTEAAPLASLISLCMIPGPSWLHDWQHGVWLWCWDKKLLWLTNSLSQHYCCDLQSQCSNRSWPWLHWPATATCPKTSILLVPVTCSSDLQLSLHNLPATWTHCSHSQHKQDPSPILDPEEK